MVSKYQIPNLGCENSSLFCSIVKDHTRTLLIRLANQLIQSSVKRKDSGSESVRNERQNSLEHKFLSRLKTHTPNCFVNLEGFEPPTSWSVIRCTIQLCYRSLGRRSPDASGRRRPKLFVDPVRQWTTPTEIGCKIKRFNLREKAKTLKGWPQSRTSP